MKDSIWSVIIPSLVTIIGFLLIIEYLKEKK